MASISLPPSLASTDRTEAESRRAEIVKKIQAQTGIDDAMIDAPSSMNASATGGLTWPR